MKTFDLAGQAREIVGKKASKAERANGVIPCVLYGGGEVLHFSVTSESVSKLIYTPNVYIVNLSVGGKEFKAIIKDMQFHPVTDRPLHLDFYQLSEDKPVVIAVPVKLNGLAEGVRSGGKLALEKRLLRIKALYTAMPDHLDIDVTALELGKSMQVGELSFEGLELMDAKEAVVCRVQLTRAARGAAAAAKK